MNVFMESLPLWCRQSSDTARKRKSRRGAGFLVVLAGGLGLLGASRLARRVVAAPRRRSAATASPPSNPRVLILVPCKSRRPVHDRAGLLLLLAEIGRASCRERV